VRLRVWAPQGSEVQFVRQVAPVVEDITPKAQQIGPLVREFPTGAWGDESRDYHVAVRVPPAPIGSERLAARVEVVVNDQVVAKGLVKAMWSADANLTTRIDPAVAHYTGQTKLAEAIQQGLAAKAAGDERTATTLLGEAATAGGRFLYATGFSGHGFLQAPAVGEVIRDLYLGRTPFVDTTPLSADRFTHGDAGRPESHIV